MTGRPHRIDSHRTALYCLLLLFASATAAPAGAQGSVEDYERAWAIERQTRGTVFRAEVEPHWSDAGDRFWYRNDGPDRTRDFVLVDARAGTREAAFDHDALAAALATALGRDVRADRLPVGDIEFTDDDAVLRLTIDDRAFDWSTADGTLSTVLAVTDSPAPRTAVVHAAPPSTRALPQADSPAASTAVPAADLQRASSDRSPDGQWLARVYERNVYLQPADGDHATPLTHDGTAADGYTNRVLWSPDSSRFIVMRERVGDQRTVHYVESAPDDQLQPALREYRYDKPGDALTIRRPRLFAAPDTAGPDASPARELPLDESLWAEPFHIRGVEWQNDGTFTFRFNQRGHQAYRILEVNGTTGDARAVIDETSDTFIDYSQKFFLRRLQVTGEAVWMSERSGHNHLYLYDWATGSVKHPITTGEFVVRRVERIDPAARRVWFWAGGVVPGQDPYFLHLCRASLDGGEVTVLTEGDGTHSVQWSPDRRTFIDTWSRCDSPPVHALRDAETGDLILELERADASRLAEVVPFPKPFTAKGRDGETDIWGHILRPTNFDPTRRYPVIEHIYAGPHGQHVPKGFFRWHWSQRLAELGFVVVRIDGMGTNWRSKAFHDVAWRNIADAGFPDRIAWIRAAGETRPWMDLERVGIYGGSAGGQNAMRAVLDHHDFYDAASADCGCHDNRMDKVWWNEAWMGWPIDEHYAASSNVVDAHKLGGALLLMVGEADTNVDPASTMQVVDALIEADKDFELIVFPGRGHGAGSSRYGTRRMWDFFVRELYGVEPRWTDDPTQE